MLSPAILTGIGGTALTGGALAGAAGAAGNLGGYVVAQSIFGGGPALSVLIAGLGGPALVGGLFAGLIGLLGGGLVALLCALF